MATSTQARRHYAKLLVAGANSSDARLEHAFATVPREDFVGSGPWTIVSNGHRITTPTADPHFIYENTMVALDEERNNGEPLLHAMWLAKIAPKAGEIVTHVGAGTGYYTAILSSLVLPRGKVFAFEIDENLAARALANLAPYGNVTLDCADAVKAPLPSSDIVYVNAGVVAPPVSWLMALRPLGRLIFPWRPAENVGMAVVVTRRDAGFAAEPFMNSWFIPCVGASDAASTAKRPSPSQARRVRSVWPTVQREPDDTAAAVFDHVWFSTSAL